MITNELNASRLSYVFAHMDNAVCVTRINGEMLYANPAAGKLFGFTDPKKRKLWENIPLIPENDALIQLFIDCIVRKRKSFQSLVDYVNNSGRRYHLHVSLIFDPEEEGMFLIVISDLTEMIRVHSAFRRYTSPDIADYVLTAPDGDKQGGAARDVTILMSDLRGFTGLSTRLSSSELVVMLNHYFECMSTVIDRFEGTIIEFLGDGIFVVFGAPKDLPSHATAAVSCAVSMQNAMADVNEWNRENGFPDLEMGIGIHSGTAVVGNIGSDKRMKYGCIGEAVNLTGRLETYAVGGQVLVSDAAAKLLSEPLSVLETKRFMPKGARSEMSFHDVAGIGGHQILRQAGPASWTDLPEALPVGFFVLDGKTVNTSRFTGSITRISPDEKYALMDTGCPLSSFQNLMFRVGGVEAYAKVLARDQDKYRLCFTAKPDHFLQLLRDSRTGE